MTPKGAANGYTIRSTRARLRGARRILRGDAAALDALGSMLTYGVGVERSPRVAAACYAVASRASYAGATYNLAGALIEGAGIPKDVQKGLRLLRAARRAASTPSSSA